MQEEQNLMLSIDEGSSFYGWTFYKSEQTLRSTIPELSERHYFDDHSSYGGGP